MDSSYYLVLLEERAEMADSSIPLPARMADYRHDVDAPPPSVAALDAHARFPPYLPIGLYS